MTFDEEKFARRVPRPSLPQPSTLDHLRALVANANAPWAHYSEMYYDDDLPRDGHSYDYRAPVWGGSDVLSAGDEQCEDLSYYEMAFAAGASLAMPLLLDLYEAVLKARPNTRNHADPVEIALDYLEAFCRPLTAVGASSSQEDEG